MFWLATQGSEYSLYTFQNSQPLKRKVFETILDLSTDVSITLLKGLKSLEMKSVARNSELYFKVTVKGMTPLYVRTIN